MTQINTGMLVLIGKGCLAYVTRVTDSGFNFRCENGAWSGSYEYADRRTFIDELQAWTNDPADITCTVQPPDDVRRDGYNSIIPWMLSQVAA